MSTARMRAVSAAVGMVMSCAAQADVVFDPASIVDHGSYISDTVNHLDWYKFSNVQNTVGLSFNAAKAEFAPLGWGAASLLQVQLLQGQFGWLGDTGPGGIGANFGLTYAMDEFLGFTSAYLTPGQFGSTIRTETIAALTSDSISFVFDPIQYQFVTFSQTIGTTDLHLQTFLTGDWVDATHSLYGTDQADGDTGTWLVRQSIDVGITPVPEPETYALLGLGLIGMYLRRRRLR
jgi:hypothetical protein